jgi:hypothetical protein
MWGAIECKDYLPIGTSSSSKLTITSIEPNSLSHQTLGPRAVARISACAANGQFLVPREAIRHDGGLVVKDIAGDTVMASIRVALCIVGETRLEVMPVRVSRVAPVQQHLVAVGRRGGWAVATRTAAFGTNVVQLLLSVTRGYIFYNDLDDFAVGAV